MRFPVVLFTSIFLPLLSSCGGNTQVAEGGIGGTGVTQGKVSGFGSLYVNDVKYEINNADFIYEEETSLSVGDDSGIKVGMVVRITGSSEDGITGQADIVEYANLLKGNISSITIGTSETGTLLAMGQNITVDPDTVYDDGGTGTPLTGLLPGAVVEVSGFTDGNGEILATRVDVIPLPDFDGVFEVKGFVSSLNEASNTFLVGSLTVDYFGFTLSTDIADGIYVEVKGTIVGDILVATSVEIEGDGDLSIAEDGEEVELDGFVTTATATDPQTGNITFTLNGQQITVDSSTEYEPVGETAASIAIKTPLKVEGVMEGTTLLASNVEIKASAEDKQELKATVEQVNILDGTFSLLGQTVTVTSSTIYEDDRDNDQLFNLSSLVVDWDFVEVDLYFDSDGSLVVSKLERESNDLTADHAEVEGVVQTVDPVRQEITVVNVTANISGVIDFNPADGDRVEIKGTYNASTGILTATSGAIE